jgi:hypothetical protein
VRLGQPTPRGGDFGDCELCLRRHFECSRCSAAPDEHPVRQVPEGDGGFVHRRDFAERRRADDGGGLNIGAFRVDAIGWSVDVGFGTVCSMPEFVPADFAVPSGLVGDGFRLSPLLPEHNEKDYRAWTGSVDHIHATPGFADGKWPKEMSLEENLGDLRRHADDFEARRGFTYTVLSPDDEVIGCVYIYPPEASGFDVKVLSWVRGDHRHIDALLHDAVRAWVSQRWPFTAVDYASRPGSGS